jgi:hypothetical protein
MGQRDYRADAETYLRSIGREEAIEFVAPKSMNEKRAESAGTQAILLALSDSQAKLEARISTLEQQQHGATES